MSLKRAFAQARGGYRKCERWSANNSTQLLKCVQRLVTSLSPEEKKKRRGGSAGGHLYYNSPEKGSTPQGTWGGALSVVWGMLIRSRMYLDAQCGVEGDERSERSRFHGFRSASVTEAPQTQTREPKQKTHLQRVCSVSTSVLLWVLAGAVAAVGCGVAVFVGMWVSRRGCHALRGGGR